MSDPKATAFNDFKNFWRNVVVQSGQVGRAYWPYYDTYVNRIQTPNASLSDGDFRQRMSLLANTIKLYFVNAQYSGNKEVLAQQIDASKAASIQQALSPRPTVTPPRLAVSQASTPAVTVQSDRIFRGEGGIEPAVNYKSTFESLKALANSNIIDIESLLNAPAPAALNDISAKVDAEIATLEKKKVAKQASIDAMNQQFVDERSMTGKVDKPKVMVLQDWILVAFAIAYIFFSVVAIIYVSSQSMYPARAGIAMSALMVIVTAVMYSWINYLA